MKPEREALIRKYASGEMSWNVLQTKLPGGYLEILASLAELGLRPPIASSDEQERARSLVREAVTDRAS